MFDTAEVSLAWGHSTDPSLAVEGHFPTQVWGIETVGQQQTSGREWRSPWHWLQGEQEQTLETHYCSQDPRLASHHPPPPASVWDPKGWMDSSGFSEMHQWVRGRTASSCTPASTFPRLALNYITWHVFRNLVWVAETPCGPKCQLSILNTHEFSKDQIPVCWNYDGREREDMLILCKGVVSSDCLELSPYSCVCSGMDKTAWTCLSFTWLTLGEFLCWDMLSGVSHLCKGTVGSHIQVTFTFSYCCIKCPRAI